MVRIKKKCDDECIECNKKVIASTITNADNPIWDLRPYQGVGVGEANTHWRVWERSGEVEYYRGEIDETGTLVGLPDQFESTFDYDGYVELQQGCPNICCDEDDWEFVPCWDEISWP